MYHLVKSHNCLIHTIITVFSFWAIFKINFIIPLTAYFYTKIFFFAKFKLIDIAANNMEYFLSHSLLHLE